MNLCLKSLKYTALGLALIVHSTFNLTGQTTRLIVIDPLVENETLNIIRTDPGQKVITLPDNGNPIKFITNILRGSSYDEVHLYLLTKPGSIIFDEINIIPENVQDYSGDFTEWKNIIKPETKIIIHSENLTSIPEGQFLIKKISEFTGKNVLVEGLQ
jgi:hypothetical protein